MAGHSKWANIQHRKGKQDAKRGKIFTKLIRMITVAAKMGGGDLSANPRLRDAVDKAKTANMTNDTIDRAIAKGAGGLEGANMESITYEGYGPNGVAVMVECLTDNKNRTVGEVRHAFTKCGGNLGTDGSVAYLFKKQGLISFANNKDEDIIMNIALDNGADDVITNDDGSIDVICQPENFSSLKNAILSKNLTPQYADISMSATTNVAINEKDLAEKMIRLQDMLEDMDDVQEVYNNADIEEKIYKELEK